ncbi:hypothetical protein Lbys_0138 [Leadbetterella byssophila DSM 17132]|uniref:Uncharacterized protein n=1 Tax=Leadbetterella byssophila (strain DSM 17132 / JCM 16389 / KACC 11308 / NBRC 106382 / 4M15) TaxID=649349 RepID=E4RTC0_LEAB4|nr:hypothetical protein [Leadbetterella byssophila]ADQ15934.1 hypothetical protein Lbys_0138 [Leadbetterella byssophila DSM 17132]
MAYTSPLFQSSFDLFSHSIEHFNMGTERDRKFVILHLANAVELIFKDLMLDLGLSIYKNPKETVTITGAIETLSKEKSIKIPHLNKLELLIDERNALQHRYGFPNELTTIFYMEATYDFFKEFLKENYNLDIEKVLEDFLEEDDLAIFKLRSVTTQTELDKLNKLTKVHPVGALLSAYAYMEGQTNEIRELILSQATGEERDYRMSIFRFFNPDNVSRLMNEYEVEIDEKTRKKLFDFRNVRNQVAHGRETVDSKQVIEFINMVKDLEPKFNELKEKVEKNPRLLIEKEKARISERNTENEQ